jgi:glycosyltransferase involved in cell wall biosynthesis
MSHTPTRVLVVIPNLGLGGAERFTVRLIRVLSRDDNPFQIEWHVAALDLSGELVSQLPRGCRTYDIGSRGRRAIRPLRNIITVIRPHTVFAVQGFVGVLLAWLRLVTPGFAFRLVLRETSLPSKKKLPLPVRILSRMTYRRIDRVICQSNDMREDVVQMFRAPPGRTVVIPNGIEEPRNSDTDLPPECADLVRSATPYITAIGRFDTVKSFDTLIRSIHLLNDETTHLVLVGYGEQERYLKEVAGDSPARERIHFTGLVEEPGPIIAGARAVVITSHYEGFPNVLLEAISRGVPICGIDAPGGIKEIYRQGFNGFFTPLREPRELADTIDKTVHTEWDRVAIQDDARTRFGIERVARRYLDVLLGSDSPRYAMVINSLQQGGAERVCALLSQQIELRGQEVVVFLLENSRFYEMPPAVQVVPLNSAARPGWKKAISLPHTWRRLRRHIRRGDFSHVISFLFFPNFLNVLIRKSISASVRYQVVISTRTNPDRLTGEGLRGKINTFLITRLYPHSDIHVSITERMDHILSRWNALPANHPVVPKPYYIEALKNKATDRSGVETSISGGFSIVSVGRLIALKRYTDIVIALSKLPTDITLVLVGDGPERARINATAVEYGVADRVHLVGKTVNPFPYIAAASLYVLSSEIEGFPNAMVEAMCLEVPILSADCDTGPREILNDSHGTDEIDLTSGIYYGTYGALYPVGNIAALVDGIRSFYDDPVLRSHYSLQSGVRSHEYSVDRITTLFLQSIE